MQHEQADRRKLLAQVHIARKDLRMEEDAYRAVLQRVTGCPSASEASEEQLRQLVAEFKRLGFKPRHRRPMSDKANVRKIYAQWASMQPHPRNGSEAALRAFVKRITGVDAPEFLDGAEANVVIEALKKWGGRLEREAIAADARARRASVESTGMNSTGAQGDGGA